MSALAAMVAVVWYGIVRSGGLGGGDLVGHAATAEWLRTLPWWDWRGWSDWFYGGQAIGVNYPPLGHAWLRLTHPVHGQMAAVALGLLVLLPWGSLRLARAVGLPHRAQHAAVAAVVVLVSASAGMHWVLSGFHSHSTEFGSWPAMLAIVLGLFAAAWAARGSGAVRCGLVVGLAGLLNASYVPATAVVCAVLVATSGVSLRQAVRWAATAAAASVAVCAWWLVPFVYGWSRIVGSDAALRDVWRYGGQWQEVVLVAVGVLAAWGACRSRAAWRLALAAAGGLCVAVALDVAGFQRVERFLDLPILVAACAAAGLAAKQPGHRSAGSIGRIRPVWAVTVAVCAGFLALRIDQHEILPLAVWPLLWRPGRTWVWAGALAWFAVLLWVPVWHHLRHPTPPEPEEPGTVMEGIVSLSGQDAEGLVHLSGCLWTNAWRVTVESVGRIRFMSGLYSESSPSAEFALATSSPYGDARAGIGVVRPDWSEVRQANGTAPLTGSAAAYAFGARWHGWCDDDEDDFTMSEVPVVAAEGVRIIPSPTEEAWHRAAVEWWIALGARDFQDSPPELARIPVLWPDAADEGEAALVDRAARGVSLHTEQDRLFVMAESAGWAWVRVPWDPWWSAPDGVPLKGGPGHMVLWVEPGVTELRWDVPGRVDAMAAGVTALSLVLLVVMVGINRREGWDIDPDRPRPAADALDRYADAADRGLLAAGRLVRSPLRRRSIEEPPAADDSVGVAGPGDAT